MPQQFWLQIKHFHEKVIAIGKFRAEKPSTECASSSRKHRREPSRSGSGEGLRIDRTMALSAPANPKKVEKMTFAKGASPQDPARSCARAF
jgi:hypothetical protein